MKPDVENNIIDFIYGLYEKESGIIFYVGRSIDPKRRMGEHRYHSKIYVDGDEWVYQYANALDLCHIEWEMKLLMECGPDTEFFEDYFINKFLLEGKPLQNMKPGDQEVWAGRHYATPEEFVAEKQRVLSLPVIKKEKIVCDTDPEKTLWDFEKPHIRFGSSQGTEEARAKIRARRK